MTLDSDDVRFMRIFAGVPWKGGVIQQWGNRKCVFLRFRTLHNGEGRTGRGGGNRGMSAIPTVLSPGRATVCGMPLSVSVPNFLRICAIYTVSGKKRPP